MKTNNVKMEKTVYLIRHAEEDRSYTGDRPITEKGKKMLIVLVKY